MRPVLGKRTGGAAQAQAPRQFVSYAIVHAPRPLRSWSG
nr:hypothetical protein RVX_0010 [Nitratidesulfovibrio sp. HK-II]